jgi:hypothetical protein
MVLPIAQKNKYHMNQFIQIFLLVTVIYLTLKLSVKTMFGEYNSLFAIMTATLCTCFVLMAQTL